MVEVAVTCEGSPELAHMVAAGALELALVTEARGEQRAAWEPVPRCS